MIALLALFAVAGISWLYRVTFTALVPPDRLPGGLQARTAVVAPAAFAALIAGHVTELPTAELPASLAAITAAALVAKRTGSHLIAVVTAGLAWSLLSQW